jgi:hypothetical protein
MYNPTGTPGGSGSSLSVQEGPPGTGLLDPGSGALAENNLGDEYLCRTGAFNCDSGKPDGFKTLFVPEPGIPSPPVPSGQASTWSRFWNWVRGTRTAGEGVVDVLRGLRAGRSAGVRVVDSSEQLGALFERLSAGGKVVQSGYPGKLVQLGDKTTVGLRSASKSGGPTIDVTLPGGQLWKVHVELPPGTI